MVLESIFLSIIVESIIFHAKFFKGMFSVHLTALLSQTNHQNYFKSSAKYEEFQLLGMSASTSVFFRCLLSEISATRANIGKL